ncbi:PDR/VanB family oxidoreductase [Lentzea sp. NPDC060358]|uniref:PDR/VanB family oxidoreductase n=1 Tax=Lentzea sp. NPDC060358 TaxID=3347103 RepID=UPI0036536832
MPNTLVRVADVTEETPFIRTLRLVRVDGFPFDPHEAGAHVDVTGPTGVVRQYSLCGPPDDTTSVLIAVKLEAASRGGSAALHTVAAGDVLEIGAPRNLLGVAAGADRHVLLAGGIGVTPLLSMAYRLLRDGAEFTLHYFARSRADAAFVGLLETHEGLRDHVHLHFGLDPDDQRTVVEKIGTGLTTDSHAYTCGPQPFMDQVTEVLAPVVGDEHVHVEHFTAAAADTSGDRAFTVELDTGEVFEVPADRSILSVLTAGGIDVFRSCEEGVCGSCVSGVLQGTPDHRDHCLSASDRAAGDQMALCVSRALTDRLVIELY